MPHPDIRPIPREQIFCNPDKSLPHISPDGEHIAYLAPHNGAMNLWVRSRPQADDVALVADARSDVYWFAWAYDNRTLLYIKDHEGDENMRLYGVNIETKAVTAYTPYENIYVKHVMLSPEQPDYALFEMNKENPRRHDVYRLNLNKGQIERIAENPGHVTEWFADHGLCVRGRTVKQEQGELSLEIRTTAESSWTTLLQWDVADAFCSEIVSCCQAGRSIYALDSRVFNTKRAVQIDCATGAATVLSSDTEYDAAELLLHPVTGKAQAVLYMNATTRYDVLDPALQSDFDRLTQDFQGDLFIISRDLQDQYWTIKKVALNGLISYTLYDRQQEQHLFDEKPQLQQYTLPEIESFSFTARDGLTIHGYIAFPPGTPRRNLPMVLNVHGGPWWRDTLEQMADEIQWLTNRGYLCLHVNFRGSTGYGKNFLNAGNKQWGRKMHDDLIDAVNWAIEQGFANREKVAIYGMSYGGYSVLAGATITPDVFCCGVDRVGPSNLIALMQALPPYWEVLRYNYYSRVGDPKNDAERLKEVSPLFLADRIRIPLLIAQGANDPRVDQSESEQIVATIQELGKECDYLLFEDEGHVFHKPENRITFYSRAEAFLAKHLAGTG